jgi:hypothetical protein
LSAAYIELELPWARWIRYLAVALDLQEQEDFKTYVLAGNDAKKFQWASPDHAGTRTPDVAEQIVRLASDVFKAPPIKGDIWALAKLRGMKPHYKVKIWDRETGKFLRHAYVDEDGNEVDVEGLTVIESKHPDAKKKAREFFGMEG